MISAKSAKEKAEYYHNNNIRYETIKNQVMQAIHSRSSVGEFDMRYKFADCALDDDIHKISKLLTSQGFIVNVNLQKPYGYGCNLTQKTIDISWR